MDTPRREVAVVCAVRTEVGPLVKNWPVHQRTYEGKSFKFFEGERIVAVCAGMGAEFARRATEAVIQLYQPEMVISAGFAGAIIPDLKVGAVVIPERVVDANDGTRFAVAQGQGVLVSFNEVAHREQKIQLHNAYGAVIVDMEAAAVARGAEARGVRFRAVKAVSDELDFVLPPLNRFIAKDGQFAVSRLVMFAAVRPWLWASFVALALNSWKAARALCERLAS